eukprot:gene25217-30459_t
MGVAISHPDFEMDENWPMKATLKEFKVKEGIMADHVVLQEHIENATADSEAVEQSPMLKAFLGTPVEHFTHTSPPNIRGLPVVPSDYAYQLTQTSSEYVPTCSRYEAVDWVNLISG